MEQLEVFHFESGRPSFEDFGNENGSRFWYASQFMGMLGYETLASFRKVVNKAMSACAALGISIQENFREEKREVDGSIQHDFKMTRFACYLTAMNGDPKKRQVAAAQAYFATIADAFRQHFQAAEEVERVLIREEVSEHEKTLSGIVATRGVSTSRDYAFFRDAGYRGMYNMSLATLKRRKGIDSTRVLFDFMGKTELAANLFRVTQTEAVIQNQDIRGQMPLENAAYRVGEKVRKTMDEISGTVPEDLPIAEDIKRVRSGLKRTHREFSKMDVRRTLPDHTQ